MSKAKDEFYNFKKMIEDCHDGMSDSIMDYIKELEGDGWRDARKELPEDARAVYVYSITGGHDVGQYFPEEKRWFLGRAQRNFDDVTAWRPIINPPAFA